MSDSKKTVMSAKFPGLIDISMDANKEVCYLIKKDGSLQIEKEWKIEGTTYTPPEAEQLPFKLPRAEAVLHWYGYDVNTNIFDDLLAYLKRFSCLSESQWYIVACNIFLSYIHDHEDIHYLPELLFYAVPERGKSKTGKAIVFVSYRGIHTQELREPILFRYSRDLRATIFFDLMDLWKKAVRNNCEDILLCRYEKGQKVARVLYPDKGPFKDMVYYDIYGPTLIATNEQIDKILNTRCIPITMPNKPGRYENPTPEMGQELKERLTAWRGRVIDKPIPEIEPIEEISGRLWDISRPLLQVCKMIYPQGYSGLKNALIGVAGQRVEDRKGYIEGQIVSALYELSPKDTPEWRIETMKLLNRLNETRTEEHKLSPQYLGKKLQAMGLVTRKVNGYSELPLKAPEFNVLLGQYGVNVIPSSNASNSLPAEILDSKGSGSMVESGRESGGEEEEVPF